MPVSYTHLIPGVQPVAPPAQEDVTVTQIVPPKEPVAVKEEVSRAAAGDARKVISEAQKLLGKSYVYGASGPDAFDCSGYVKYVYNLVGIDLPRIAEDQADCGIAVERDALQPGDLVFFGYYGSGTINHTGIYIGDNQFIHSSTNNGVIITSLDSSYYDSNYKEARRLLR